jgi:ABC-type polysaccharide/polyol phosphate export permease
MTPPVEALRTPLFYGEAPTLGVTVYLAVETLVALALGALVFSRVDDRIAAEA